MKSTATNISPSHKQSDDSLHQTYHAPNIPVPPTIDDASFYQTNGLCNGSLNVCGLKRRIHYPEFIETIKQFDVICMSETKLTDTDVISCEGFTFFNAPTRQKFTRSSGGIGFLVKNSLTKFVSF